MLGKSCNVNESLKIGYRMTNFGESLSFKCLFNEKSLN